MKQLEIPSAQFQTLCYVAYSITIYKSQGSTFDVPYTIHAFNNKRFDDRLQYVSLSRSTTIKHINLLYHIWM